MGYDVWIAEYRGFGESTGTPSEKGLRIDAQTVLDAVLADPERDRAQKPIFVHGHSLGTAVAIDLASQKVNSDKISGLILDTPFTSISGLIKSWPRFGFLAHLGFLFSEKWPSDTRIAQIPVKVPLLVVAPNVDPVVPVEHGKRLYEIALERGRGGEGNRGDKGVLRVGEEEEEEERGEVTFELVDLRSTWTAAEKKWDVIEEFMGRAVMKIQAQHERSLPPPIPIPASSPSPPLSNPLSSKTAPNVG
ncbi:hypothetical protein CVT24_011655 [Panaeolus cyanescens]|uniref:Serine aminopeptidase S33 domain-containing protein n=1 Tax=Panaeolus cyanescens TaxID=181874 RepID=A0A409WE67_9AGAR|nr:hypothetical protein CVT24_011655 [Panaeolus cyanescens]